jgi:hypothetical protein
MSNYEDIKNILAETMAEDIEWLSHGRVAGQKPDPVYNPWMPFQMADFIAIMAEVVSQSEGNKFLDVGSGIGTKIAVAQELFKLNAVGIEYDREMMKFAHSKNRFTNLGDALLFDRYHWYDIIWMYRPFRDPLSQAKLEHKVYENMKPGAIIAGAALTTPPNGFELVIDDWDTGCRGAWKKPANWEPVIYDFNEDDSA